MAGAARGVVFEPRIGSRYGKWSGNLAGDPQPRCAMYFARSWTPDRPLHLSLHGTPGGDEGGEFHQTYFRKQMSGWPLTCVTQQPGAYGARWNGHDYRLLGNGLSQPDDPVPVPAGLAPVGMAWPWLAERHNLAVVCPQSHVAGNFSSEYHSKATWNCLRSILDELLERGWIADDTPIILDGHSSGADTVGNFAWAYASDYNIRAAIYCHGYVEPVAANLDVYVNSYKRRHHRWEYIGNQIKNPFWETFDGAYTFRSNPDAQAVKTLITSGSSTADGNGSKSYCGLTRDAKANWCDGDGFDVRALEFVSAAHPFTGYDAALHGPTIDNGAGGNYHWPHGAHDYGRINAVRFGQAVLAGEDLARWDVTA